jgi:hypothetical protein
MVKVAKKVNNDKYFGTEGVSPCYRFKFYRYLKFHNYTQFMQTPLTTYSFRHIKECNFSFYKAY